MRKILIITFAMVVTFTLTGPARAEWFAYHTGHGSYAHPAVISVAHDATILVETREHRQCASGYCVTLDIGTSIRNDRATAGFFTSSVNAEAAQFWLTVTRQDGRRVVPSGAGLHYRVHSVNDSPDGVGGWFCTPCARAHHKSQLYVTEWLHNYAGPPRHTGTLGPRWVARLRWYVKVHGVTLSSGADGFRSHWYRLED